MLMKFLIVPTLTIKKLFRLKLVVPNLVYNFPKVKNYIRHPVYS